jgi:hypothetical protein
MTLPRVTANLSVAGFVASALIATPVDADPTQVRYRTQAIDNIEIF